jgi:hypothetical protein
MKYWVLGEAGKHFGPFSAEAIMQFVESGRVSAATRIARQAAPDAPMGPWIQLGSVRELGKATAHGELKGLRETTVDGPAAPSRRTESAGALLDPAAPPPGLTASRQTWPAFVMAVRALERLSPWTRKVVQCILPGLITWMVEQDRRHDLSRRRSHDVARCHCDRCKAKKIAMRRKQLGY